MANCNSCVGKGTTTCTTCNGSGNYKALFGLVKRVCSACKGSGNLPCAACGGTGQKKTDPKLDLPLLQAVKSGNASDVSGLLKRGANPDAEQFGGLTPLMIAAEKGHEEIVNLLIEYGANVHARTVTTRLTNEGPNALMRACDGGHYAIVSRLIAAGSDVNVTNGKMETPLVWAVRGNHAEIVDLLLANSARPAAFDDWSRPVLKIAIEKGNDRIVSALRKAGAPKE